MAGSIVRGGKVGSVASLRKSLKKKSGGFTTRVPAEGGITIRFLTEPEEWVSYFEHYDDVRKFYPCVGEDNECPGCIEGDRPTQRYIVNAVDVGEDKVIALVLQKTLASSVLKKYDRYNTLLDRNYDLSKTGTGFETEFDVESDQPSRMNMRKFDPIDLEAMLEQMAPGAGDDEDEDEEEKPRGKARSGGRSTNVRRRPVKRTTSSRSTQEDDDDDEDEPAPRRVARRPAKKAVARKIARRR